MTRRNRLAARPRIERLDERCVLSTLTPALLRSAYGLDSVSFSNGAVKGTGKGQTIAIVDAFDDPFILSDLATFSRKYGLPVLAPTSTPAVNGPTSTAASTITVYNLAGPATDPGWNQETALDVEWAHAVAPDANIILVEAASASTRDLIAAVNGAKGIAEVTAVSMSWGSAEFAGQTAYDGVFTTPAGHKGITFLASAGDSGAGAEWPASSPNVVSVGGTSLTVGASGSRLGETYWSGTGGGTSRYEPEPTYQAARQSTGHRSGPDVAAVADPNTGVLIISGGQTLQVGGTSLGSPVWAGLVSLANQGRALAGQGSLDGPTQTLPKLYAAPAGSFNDITTGPGTRATAGYDTATGLGSPNARTLVSFLAGGPSIGGAGTTSTGSGSTIVGTTTGTVGTTTGPGKTTTITPPRPPLRWQIATVGTHPSRKPGYPQVDREMGTGTGRVQPEPVPISL
jgi:subtilase family serine protease